MTDVTDRYARLDKLVAESNELLERGIKDLVHADGRRIAAVCVLFSGGKDSTVLAHLMRKRADCAVHINTGIGIEQTRQFVRDTCRDWDLPLIEEHPPVPYRDLVIERGFPGPAHHWKMYTRLKERALEQVRSALVKHPYKERVVFLAGRRRDESLRRFNAPENGRKGSIVWISPIVNWTALDLNTYRLVNPDVPTNEVSDLIHMSGECLCGAFAKPRELDEVGLWFPEVKAHIEALQDDVRAAGHPEEICQWGWGAYRVRRRSKVGLMCSSCAGEDDG